MGLPLVSFFVLFFCLRKHTASSLSVSLFCSAIPLVCAYYLLISLWDSKAPILFETIWMRGGEASVSFGFLLDPISLLMLCIVATISFLVQVYSLGYMAGDPGITRYYSFLSIFAWSMISMVVAPGLMQLYVFWELVGLSSYLLIGFWHHKFSASQAGKKAFVMTRLGDLGFFLGIVILLLNFGDLSILNLNHEALHKLPPSLVTTCAVLIFCGVIGKSAQFPLLTWLPDAMEGPTPVSALLHSATMVAAGVYLTGRLFPFFQGSPEALAVVLLIGALTMILSSTMAMVARDIKQVWAYSTVSQLGYMLMGLGAGSYFSGIFHLTTHAAFKALLFLCSGVFIHHFETNDFFQISRRGGRSLKIPMIAITVAGCGLAGIFPFAGFFSKEAVLGALVHLPNKTWIIAGLAGAFMTAYYTFRLLFVLWLPRTGSDTSSEHGHHASGHASHAEAGYWAMAVPLLILAAATAILGFTGGPLESFLVSHGAHAAPAHAEWLVWASIVLVVSGVGLAWFEFGRKAARQEGFLSRLPFLENLFMNRWYIDHFYRKFVDYAIYGGFSRAFTLNDRRVIDGAVDGLSKAIRGSGWLMSFSQSGKLQYNLFFLALGIALLGLFFLFV
ncbi:MAG: NADH-quinone oxidoreductase subunit L [Deltaproteobacteria bacterium]|nr:NADH-quinone oxidoreductase subunit L [Deltaproteobacteria bacterium]